MQLGRSLTRAFYERSSVEVARELVGCLVVRRLDDGRRLVGRLVELEAYLGDGSDPGSHAHRGETQRNRSMFGDAGRMYAYRSYGIHTCVNLVCLGRGEAAAVLLRALEPIAGTAAMAEQRRLPVDESGPRIASGPGRLAQALALGLEHDGASVLRGALTVHAPLPGGAEVRVATSTRVGLTKGAELAYRFYDAESRFVSPWRPGARRRLGAAADRARST